jgi:hypothetical protein
MIHATYGGMKRVMEMTAEKIRIWLIIAMHSVIRICRFILLANTSIRNAVQE